MTHGGEDRKGKPVSFIKSMLGDVSEAQVSPGLWLEARHVLWDDKAPM